MSIKDQILHMIIITGFFKDLDEKYSMEIHKNLSRNFHKLIKFACIKVINYGNMSWSDCLILIHKIRHEGFITGWILFWLIVIYLNPEDIEMIHDLQNGILF